WDDEVRLMLEERASFSPDALTRLEANLRLAGPETMKSPPFARLTARQNWIFQRPNATGDEGALKSYGTGKRPTFDPKRVELRFVIPEPAKPQPRTYEHRSCRVE